MASQATAWSRATGVLLAKLTASCVSEERLRDPLHVRGGQDPLRSCVWTSQNPAAETPCPLRAQQGTSGKHAQDETRRGVGGAPQDTPPPLHWALRSLEQEEAASVALTALEGWSLEAAPAARSPGQGRGGCNPAHSPAGPHLGLGLPARPAGVPALAGAAPGARQEGGHGGGSTGPCSQIRPPQAGPS